MLNKNLVLACAVAMLVQVPLVLPAQVRTPPSYGPVATDYLSIQAALDANRGKMVYLPPGDYRIEDKLRITGENSGLFGPGRIIQANLDRVIVEIEHASGAQLRDV
ncbi:MAG TPA: hypothetical protein VHV55_02330, partial [Pirellulales bacterium]|nr:hypothetical protein [Pirellulales bacterium]